MQGKIIKGIAGFYYVYVEGLGEVECKAKGVFRYRNEKPLVGDDVEVMVLDAQKKTGNIVRILERKNALIRPAVANVDQAIVVFAAADPQPNRNLLDRFLVMMEREEIPAVICINKQELNTQEAQNMKSAYEAAGYEVCVTSLLHGQGTEEIRGRLSGKTTVLAGPSGVGKSTLTNLIQPQAEMETGSISDKIRRGKHTTRHTELIYVGQDTFLMDTPGFSSFYLPDMEKEELKECFPEFIPYAGQCRFKADCVHIGEPDCGVKQALFEGRIDRERYENYCLLYEELKQKKRY